jgi:hypothetical protein
MAEMLEAI